MMRAMTTYLLVLESFLLYLLPPVLIMGGVLPKAAVMPLLWVGMFYALFVMRHDRTAVSFKIGGRTWKRIALRFLALGTLLTLFVRFVFPEMFFAFPLERPGLWLLILLLYPLLSVLAQEIIFRAFFVYRFGPLADKRTLLVTNALIFAYIHAVFGNAVAVVFSFLGGLLFMSTYLKTRSVAASSFEHALYGDLVFSLGIGHFFYHGA